jgi:predicted transcriptional regulator
VKYPDMQRTITCTTCDGKGIMPLPESLAQTLSEMRGKTTSEKLAKKIPGVSRNAQNNRLEKLRRLNLVTRERHGKEWIYTTV